MIASPNDTVLVNVENAICTVRINRPDSLNALNDDVVSALIEVFSALRYNRDIRCVVLTGSGDYFIAGGDVKRFKSKFDAAESVADTREWFESILGRIHGVVEDMNHCRMPIVGAVKGAVAGAGFSLMLGCDLVIASEETVFTLAYCHLGTSPDGGATWHLPRTVGMKAAMEIALLGDRFSPEQAQKWGLINSVVPRSDLDDHVASLATRLANGPTHAHAHAKHLLLGSGMHSLHDQLHRETAAFVSCAMSPDFREGVDAFVEKRKPSFRGVPGENDDG